MSRREEILFRLREIPAMPAAAVRAIRVLQDPDADATDIMKALRHDAGLTANVLRLANSAYFGSPRSVGSIREAAVRLGTRRILSVVVASAAAPVVCRPVRGYDLPPEGLWEHSVSVAAGAEALAEVLRMPVPAATFTAGLLHDIGKVVMGNFVAVEAEAISGLARREDLAFDEAERGVLGIDHAEVGAAVLELWDLPEEVLLAVRWHHRPEAAGSGHGILDLVHAADALSVAEGLGGGRDGLRYRPSAEVAARLGLTTRIEEQAACRVLAALADLRDLSAGPDPAGRGPGAAAAKPGRR